MTPDTADITPRLQLPLIEGGQALKHITHNEALLDLDTLLFIVLDSLDVTTPPAGSDRLTVIVGVGGADDFEGQDGKIASRVDGSWRFYTPLTGLTAWLTSDSTQRVFDGQTWKVTSGEISTLAKLGIGTDADNTNRLAVKSPAALFTHDDQAATPTGDMRVIVNRNSDSDTASITFQTSHQGSAEFGLTGDTNFSLKTSADGLYFGTAVLVNTENGNIGMGTRDPRYNLDINDEEEDKVIRAAVTNTALSEDTGAAISVHSGASENTALIQYNSEKAYLITTAAIMTYRARGTNGWHRFFSNNQELMRVRPTQIDCHVPLELAKVTVETLPSPIIGQMIFVLDDSLGAGPAYADGVSWRRMSDRTVVN